MKSEKAKTKFKGAKLPKGLNVTKTEFKVRKIVIRDQIKEPTIVDGAIVKSNIKVIHISSAVIRRKSHGQFYFVGSIIKITTSQCRKSKRGLALSEGNHNTSSARDLQAFGRNYSGDLSIGIGSGEGSSQRVLQSIESGICFTNSRTDFTIFQCGHIVLALCYDTHQHPNSRGFAIAARLPAIVYSIARRIEQ